MPAGTYRYCFCGFGYTINIVPSFTIYVNDNQVVSWKPSNELTDAQYRCIDAIEGTIALTEESTVRLYFVKASNNGAMNMGAGGIARIGD